MQGDFENKHRRAPHQPRQLSLPILSRAKRPRAPLPSPGVFKGQAERADYLRERETLEQRSVLRGLVLLALVAFVVSVIRAGAERAFYVGWWRQW